MINDQITKAIAEAYKKMKQEELTGDQHKIDANKNNKIDAHDFKLLRAKNEETEPKSEKEKSLAALAAPHDKITHKDVLVGRGVIKNESWDSKKHAVSEQEKVELEEASKVPEGMTFVAGYEHKGIRHTYYRKGKKVTDPIVVHINGKEWKEFDNMKKANDEAFKHIKTMKEEVELDEVKEPTGDLKDACWKGYTAVGLKKKNGRTVPNCVPKNEEVELDEMDKSQRPPGRGSENEYNPGGKEYTGKPMSRKEITRDALNALKKSLPTIKKEEKEDAEKDESPPFKGPYTKTPAKQPGQKSDPGYSLVRHLARQAMNKKMKKEEVELTEGNDDVGEMIKDKLKIIINRAKEMHDGIGPNTDMPEWVKSKITLAQDYVSTACDYSCGSEQLGEEVELNETENKHTVMFQTKKSKPISLAHYDSEEDAQKFVGSINSSGGKAILKKPSIKSEEVNEGLLGSIAKGVAINVLGKMAANALTKKDDEKEKEQVQEVENKLSEDMEAPDIKVRSTYTQAYAKHYKNALRMNPKGASTKARIMAYDTVEAKHGKEHAEALKDFHDKNQNEEVEITEELSSRAKMVKELYNKAKERKKKDVFEADPEMEMMPSPQYSQPKK